LNIFFALTLPTVNEFMKNQLRARHLTQHGNSLVAWWRWIFATTHTVASCENTSSTKVEAETLHIFSASAYPLYFLNVSFLTYFYLAALLCSFFDGPEKDKLVNEGTYRWATATREYARRKRLVMIWKNFFYSTFPPPQPLPPLLSFFSLFFFFSPPLHPMFLLFFYNIDIAVNSLQETEEDGECLCWKNTLRREDEQEGTCLWMSVARFTSQTKLKKYYRQNERIKICAIARPEED
jgi:hypothetical protein